MRICSVLLPVAAAAAIAAPGAAAAQGTAYIWAQPGVMIVENPFSSLPLLLPRGPMPLAELPILTTYRWAQPGSATVTVELAQPLL